MSSVVATRDYSDLGDSAISATIEAHVSDSVSHVTPADRERWDSRTGGAKGDPGKDGKDGKSLTWDDLTVEQKASLKGEKGDPLTWGDLTDDQKASLKGDPLTWDDLTAEQKASLKGDPGADGVLRFDDLTPEQKASLKGSDGTSFTWNDLTEEQKAELKGEKGDPLTWDDLTDSQKASLKGEPGRDGTSLTFADLTEAEKLQLKGDPGTSITWNDLTDAQKAALKGEKGDKGDGPGTYTPVIGESSDNQTVQLIRPTGGSIALSPVSGTGIRDWIVYVKTDQTQVTVDVSGFSGTLYTAGTGVDDPIPAGSLVMFAFSEIPDDIGYSCSRTLLTKVT